MAHDWPGNIRELENVTKRAVVLSKGELLAMDDLPASLRGSRKVMNSDADTGAVFFQPAMTLAERERHAIQRTLAAVGGSTAQAARWLDISVRKVQYRIRE